MSSRYPADKDLVPYLPRYLLEWQRSNPDSRWQETDASLVFADISGFTALSERLARKGRVGAEELVSTLNGCFTELLAVAYAAGGSLLKFGGDALLLMFDGTDHAYRACVAALGMQNTMARAGRVTTSAGSLRLRMSTGVHSGHVQLFRVGDSHEELVITGPAATAALDMEASAESGEVVISRGTSLRVDSSWVAGEKGPGLLLRRVGPDLLCDEFPEIPDPVSDIARAIPTALRQDLQAGLIESEHRQATVAFLHFDGTDERLRALGAESVASALENLISTIQRAADSDGVTFLGTDVDRDGGKVMLVAGAPRVLGDDSGRMLSALRRVIDASTELPIRIGVNVGHVFAGAVGPTYRKTYTVMGDAVNLAARVMGNASPGQLLATPEVLAASLSRFEARPVTPFRAKGKSELVQALAIGDFAGRGDLAQEEQIGFVGRRDELKVLERVVDDLRSGRGTLVELVGPPGIGKSRLLEELRSEFEGVRVVRAFCESFEAHTPYFALRHLLRGLSGLDVGGPDGGRKLEELLDHTAPELLDWAPLLADVLHVDVGPTEEVADLEPRFRRQRTRLVVQELIRKLTHEPTMLIVEDAQWIDDLSATAISGLANPTNPLAVFVIAREANMTLEAPPGTHLRLELGPLDTDEMHELVTSASRSSPLPPHELAALLEHGGGNPLFLEQLLRTREAFIGGSLPETLEAVIAADIDLLPADERRLLRYAAVLGSNFEVTLLDSVLDPGMKTSAGVLRRLGRYLERVGTHLIRFRNPCYRQVAYETLPFRRRRDLHARAGQALEGATQDAAVLAGVLSFHFLHAQEYRKCWHYATLAARVAESKFANAEAVVLYERALKAARGLPDLSHDEVSASWEALGEAARACSQFDRAHSAWNVARRLRSGDPALSAQLCAKQASVALMQGRRTNSVRWVRRGLRLVEVADGGEDLAVRASLEVMYAELLQQAGRHRQAVKWCSDAIAHGRRSGNRRATALAYGLLDRALVDLGRANEAVHNAIALEIWEELGELVQQAYVLVTFGVFAYQEGRWGDAVMLDARAREVSLRAGDLAGAAMAELNSAEILLMQGRHEAAQRGLGDALEMFQAVRHVPGTIEALKCLGAAALRQGDVMGAMHRFGEASTLLPSVGQPVAIELDGLRAECLLRTGDAGSARVAVDAALRHETSGGGTTFVPMLRRLRGYICVALGREEEAWAEFDGSLRVARDRGARYEIALTLEAISATAAYAGMPPDPAADLERRELLDQLGVIATPPPPIPDDRGLTVA